ncbi:MAG: hypothetical protein R2824_31320 [Saprospiraceae bacterium]|nr:hypothetical protein [Lewinella sp.]
MLNWLHKMATGRNVIIFFVLDLIMMMGVMPYASGRLQEAVGGEQEVPPLDLSVPTYSVDFAHESVAAYGEAGRAAYRTIELTADVIYPLIYGLAFALLIAFFWSRIAPRVRWLPLLAVATVLFDYGENAMIITMLNSFPEQSNLVARLSSIFSLGKWILVFTIMGLALVGFVIWLVRPKASKT